MGNNSSIWSSLNFMKKGNKQKGSKKRKSKRANGNSQPTSVAPMYDTVADFPVYAVVDKNKNKPRPPNVNDNVQYAVIEVVKPPHGNSHMKPVESSATTTEYATINFTPTYNAVKGTLV